MKNRNDLCLLQVETLEVRQMLSTVQILASGETGNEQFEVEINDLVVGTFDASITQETFSVETDDLIEPGIDVVRVRFLNDKYIVGVVDYNLFVDKIVVDGVAFESESSNTYSTGTWVGEGLSNRGFLQSNALHMTGYFEYEAPSTKVIVRASGDEGTEQMQLQIDGQTVSTFDLTTSFLNYEYLEYGNIALDRLRIAFTGDVYEPENNLDANVNVEWMEVDGVRFQTDAPTVYSTGTWKSEDGITPGYGRGETLHTDGYFQYTTGLQPDAFSIPEDSVAVPLAVQTNDNSVNSISIEIVSGPENGTATMIGGVITYTPNAEFVGTDRLTYREAGTLGEGVQVEITVNPSHQQPQSLINSAVASELTPSGKFLVIEKLVKIPLGENNRQPRVNGMVTSGDRVFVWTDGGIDGEGKIYELVKDSAGNTTAQLFLDAGAAIFDNSGIEISNLTPLHGLRAVAIHPDFQSNGKFYLAYTAERPADPSQHNYLSDPENPVAIESVLAEFTYDWQTGQVDTSSFREVFRVGLKTLDHPISGLAFNQFAEPGDDDYGLLYVGHGDGSEQSAIAGDGQNNDALGKVLRINPLQSSEATYTSPATNPFINSLEFPDAVFAIGFRNPHNLTFAKDLSGGIRLIVTEIGRDNVEEINIVVGGGNYGWADREGIFVHQGELGGINGNIFNLPADEAENGYIYPVSIFGHGGIPGDFFVGQAITGSHVIQNGSSDLDDQFVFVEFATDGRAYHIDFSEMLQQTTTLDANDPDNDSPADLTWLTPQELTILFDHDNDDSTTALVRDSLKDVLDDEPDFEAIPSAGKIRADLRLGQGPKGELYILNKRNGWIYLVTNTVAPVVVNAETVANN